MTLLPKDWGQSRPLNAVRFESPSHSGILLSGLDSLRARGHLLDVTLIAGDESFRAHRAVLASCSDYFRAMFTTHAMKESREDRICLNGVSAQGMRLLLDYAYTSRLSLDPCNVQDVLAAASHLQLVPVVQACSAYLQAQLDLENCVDVATIAETYSLHQLRKTAYRFMCGHLEEFSETADFQRLSGSQLEYLLGSDFPVDCPEDKVLGAVAHWLGFNLPERIKCAPRLLAKVHFEEVAPRGLQGLMDSRPLLQCLLTQHFPLYRQIVTAAFKDARSSLSEENLVNSRGMEMAVVKVGGFGIGGVTNDITYFLPSVGKWRHLTTVPHVDQCNSGTAVLNNELYVVGGCFNQSLQENIHPFGFCFNPRYNKWTTMAPMQRERCRFSLNVVMGELYAVGGVSESSEDNPADDMCPCERYDASSDSWHCIASLPGSRSQHAGAAWNHLLFVSGGLEQDFVMDSLLCYDSRSDVWEPRSPMLTPRADHCTLTYKDRLYVCGGWYEDEATGNRLLATTVDAYDILADRWDVITHVPTPRYHAGIVIVDAKLYFVGGFHSDATFDRATGVIECYDLEEDKWACVEKYPQDIWEHTCVTLYIPRCRDDMEVISDTPRT